MQRSNRMSRLHNGPRPVPAGAARAKREGKSATSLPSHDARNLLTYLSGWPADTTHLEADTGHDIDHLFKLRHELWGFGIVIVGGAFGWYVSHKSKDRAMELAEHFYAAHLE